jgi:hypothetical protein
MLGDIVTHSDAVVTTLQQSATLYRLNIKPRSL